MTNCGKAVFMWCWPPGTYFCLEWSLGGGRILLRWGGRHQRQPGETRQKLELLYTKIPKDVTLSQLLWLNGDVTAASNSRETRGILRNLSDHPWGERRYWMWWDLWSQLCLALLLFQHRWGPFLRPPAPSGGMVATGFTEHVLEDGWLASLPSLPHISHFVLISHIFMSVPSLGLLFLPEGSSWLFSVYLLVQVTNTGDRWEWLSQWF